MIEDLVQQLLDRVDHRYYGKYRGYVHAVDDPEGLGRIRAIVPRLLGEDTPTGWAMPCAPYAGPDQGFFAVPEVGAGVWIEFEGGDLSRPIWTGTWWGRPSDDDVANPDSSARIHAGAATEVPQHGYPRENATPLVRILKSATGHHVVLDDRPDHERIEIHDSRGNRIILSPEGLERIVSNDRTYNKGALSADIDGDERIEIAGGSERSVGRSATTTIGGSETIEVRNGFSRKVGRRYELEIGPQGFRETMRLPRTTSIGGSDTRTVSGAISDTAVGGIGMSSGAAFNVVAATGVDVTAGMPSPPSLNAVSISAGLGNVSINTFLGILQLGGTGAVSPLVLGDGLLIHFTLLATLAKMIYPVTAIAYGPALDVWAATTPAVTWSYFGYVKRLPVG